jgi:hypothetical protein
MEAAHTFRLFLKNCMQPRKSNKGTTAEKPNQATIWVAKRLPSWQATVLMTLKELLDVSFVLCLSYSLCRAEIRFRGK